jgi:hypothetical protein
MVCSFEDDETKGILQLLGYFAFHRKKLFITLLNG